ncbi:ankyrin repeat domain-containing protein 66-like [Genypterus blacodes]|uniref:ankyrin repeat domain-containing protein 66-like n=1 Tax=Genypterus blacodes TaxID=154954 RepID=UPI003F76F566
MSELHEAAAAGNFDQVEELLTQNKSNANQKDVNWSNKTPLHWAAAKGHTDIVRILMEHGARPCLRTEHGWTPAHCAAESNQLAVLHLLHSVQAPIDLEDNYGDKPVRIAEIYGQKECVDFLKDAEVEARANRIMAAIRGITLDDTDEEWAQLREGKKRKKRDLEMM